MPSMPKMVDVTRFGKLHYFLFRKVTLSTTEYITIGMQPKWRVFSLFANYSLVDWSLDAVANGCYGHKNHRNQT